MVQFSKVLSAIRRNKQVVYRFLMSVMGNKRFFYALIVLIVLQGLWFALTYEPGLFDEKQHFDYIDMYSQRWSPFITEQSTEWDSLGETTRNPNYLFYYLLSWPLRALKAVTDSYFVQVFSLRMLFLGIFIGGVVAYRKLLVRMGASLAIANLVLLLIVLTPAFASFTAVINYDLVIFALFPLLALMLIDITGQRKPEAKKFIAWLVLGMLTCLIKFSFLPIFAAMFLYLAFDTWNKHRTNTVKLFRQSWRSLSKGMKLALATILIVSAALIIERPVLNAIQYQKITPSCTKILSEERCLKNYTTERSILFKRVKPDNFMPYNPVEYLLHYWFLGILRMEVRVIATAPILPMMKILFYGASAVGILLFLLYLRDFMKDRIHKMLLLISGAYLLALVGENYASYIRLGQPVAITTRYLLPILPILLYFIILAAWRAIGRRAPNLFALFAVGIIVVLLTQGGSITTHLLTVRDYYWGNSETVLSFNRKLIDATRTIVVESNPFLR